MPNFFGQILLRMPALCVVLLFPNIVSMSYVSTKLSCISSLLRQLMVFQSDLHKFVTLLQRLGPQLSNAPLIYDGVPELRDILSLFDISVPGPEEALSTAELRARFQGLVENVLGILAETKLLCLVSSLVNAPYWSSYTQLSKFIDDLQFADESFVDVFYACCCTQQ
jgi:hypothetical protein